LKAEQVDFTDRETLDGSISDRGTVTLRWNVPEASEVVIQQAPTAGFSAPVVRYQGRDSASVLTGLPEGSHFFRVGEISGEASPAWSPPLEIRVVFTSRTQLFTLLALGSIVVGATFAAIFLGHFNANRRENS
tara:strand:+ start:1842 stop:2240 length:399 start_codon:yes stop_codon:yes gene_type:complete